MVVFYIFLSILLFGVLILVHEFGHFITAKLSGVQVNEFSLFMGPAIWKKQIGETLYAIRCVPIGGYCAMEGEDGDSDNPRAFGKAKVWKRLVILIAGSFMNFVTGLLIAVILFACTYQVIPGTTLGTFHEEFDRYASEGLQPGDEICAIDGERVYVSGDITMLLERNVSGVFDLTVCRDGEMIELKDFSMPKRDYDGNGILRYGITLPYEEKTVGSLLSYSWNTCIDFVRLVRLGLEDLFTGKNGVDEMSGPVGIVNVVVEAGTEAETVGLGIANVFYFFAFIAINLSVMNLLPIPALDGGRAVCLLLTAAVEKITRRRINPKFEGYLHAGFMILLLAFMALITFKDIFRIFSGS